MTSESSDSRFQQLARLPKYYAAQALNRYRRLGIFGKANLCRLFSSGLLFNICPADGVVLVGTNKLIFIIVLTPTRIFQFLSPRLGPISTDTRIVLVSFPPFIGHTTTVTVCGFAYGWRIGFLIAAAASIIGSATVFCVLRLLFSSRLRQWSAKNAKFMALESVVVSSLPLIILIRVSPFPPWVYSNSLFASIQSVALWQFVVATAFVFPKLLLHAFIGSRMAALSDGNQREEMDTSTKILNGCLVGGGILVAVLASWLVYRLVQNHIRKLEGVSPAVDELAAEAIEDFNEEAPLLGSPQES
ncbi:Golgi apparatus membrane protein TVP38 [Lentinula detonsa]|uniref:Golgi apparatus membrane protein TVP38 n=1 Tax=Lentinula detonsa TaxID=2804962 RepID=A0AA38Q4Y3_9AGAR|nr:Golgi apparatus membrane protein TVP38 [Lentinula detonsa]